MVRCTQVSQEDARFLRLGSRRCICSGRRHGLAPWQGLLAAQIENTFVQVEFDSSQVMREGSGAVLSGSPHTSWPAVPFLLPQRRQEEPEVGFSSLTAATGEVASERSCLLPCLRVFSASVLAFTCYYAIYFQSDRTTV